MSTVTLPENCDRAAAAVMLPELAALAGGVPLEIDGTSVRQIGQAMLQVLLSARRSGPGAIISASPALREAARITGLEAALLDLEAA
ncbi:MAG: hypothetical protein RLZZ08_178 [Pseudomonadota bacterium]|jgi:anti-anti-sigma regulatory factor